MLVTLLHKDATFSRATEGSVGYDLTACDIELGGDADAPITYLKLGIKTAPDDGFFFMAVPRSSFPKTGYFMPNSIGIIDPDYRGEWKMQIAPIMGRRQISLNKIIGTRVAQAIIVPVIHHTASICSQEMLGETTRGEGGFGSTGK